MEAVKRLPMISFELKSSPEATSFHNLKQCIAEYYGEDPDSYGKEFRELEELRGLACRPRIEMDCCAIVKRYYAQLHSLQNRFPLSSSEELLNFAWRDIYSSSVWHTNNIKYEMAAVLYNVAALHSKLGVEEERVDPESMKLACTHFQCAAWAYGEIKNQYGSLLKGDLSVELLIFKQQISFAQAQECILEKSLADNRKAAIIAKVTAQVISFYNTASTMLFSQNEEGTIQDLIGGKLYKEWQRYIKFKTSYLSAVLLMYQGIHAEEQRKMGERVALYNAACEMLESAKKEVKGMSNADVINEALVLATDIIEGKRKNAKQENEFIYHEMVPDISNISAVQGANLVQGIPFEVTDSQIIGEDIFKRLVPMKTHENLSLYSEEKANILRRLGGKIDERDTELAMFMGSLNMDVLNSMKQPQERLPQNLVDKCAELSAKPNAISDLVESMSNLATICSEVEFSLNEIKSILDEESKQEANYQKQMGKRPTGHMTELTREFTKYFDAHAKAGESNDTLRKAMELHVSNLRILAQPLSALRAQVPQSDSIDEAVRKDLEALLNKVEEMKMQRDQLFDELRDQILNKDDITAQLLAHGEKDVDELFKKELKKYSQSVSIIEQNLVAQGNILKALTDTYAKHAMTLKAFNDAKSRREQFYSGLIGSFDVYEDLIGKSSKGLDFYKKLHANIQKLMSRVKGARDVQDEERQQLLKKAAPKVVHEIKPSVPSMPVNPMMNTQPPTGGSGLKLKDYIKSGMVPGMGANSLRDDLSKLPSVRPTPVGQENIPITACSTMSYPTSSTPSAANYSQQYMQYSNMYTNQQNYYQSDQRHSAHDTPSSLSSSSSSDYYNNQQGYVNPMYQQGYQNPYYQYNQNQAAPTVQNYGNYNNQQLPSTASTQTYSVAAVSQPGAVSQYSNYQTQQNVSTYPNPYNTPEKPAEIKQQVDGNAYGYNMQYPQNQATNNLQYPQQNSAVSQAPQDVSKQQVNAYGYSNNLQYNQQNMAPPVQQSQAPNQQVDANAYGYGNNLQYPQQNPSNVQQNSSNIQNTAVPQNPGINQQMPSVPQNPGINQQMQSVPQDAPKQQVDANPYGYPQQNNVNQHNVANNPQNVTGNPQNVQQNVPASQQNQDAPPSQQSGDFIQNIYKNQLKSPTQQFTGVIPNPYSSTNNGYQQQYQNYSYQHQYSSPSTNSSNSYMSSGHDQPHVTESTNYAHHQNQEATFNYANDSLQNQTTMIEAHATTATASHGAMTQSTSSQQNGQVTSPVENKSVKSENMDLLSGIDFSISEDIPTLMPMSMTPKKEETPKKVSEPAPVVEAPPITPVKMNSDLADLDFGNLNMPAVPETPKILEPAKPRKIEDPFEDVNVLKNFHKEVEGLEKYMETLTVKTLSGITPLANKWKELQDLLVKDESSRSISIAKLFPDKNRFTDSLPYDHGRVLLPTATDNYINAVFVKDCGQISFIMAQTPLDSTVNDWWEMVWSQKANVLVCLHSSTELLDPFWPQNINEEKSYGEISVVLQKQFELSHCFEKTLKVSRHGSDVTSNISLLQVKTWKKRSADQILDVSNNIITTFKQNNPNDRQYSPIILNCISGGTERSGLITLGISAILATQMKKPILLNIVDHWFRVCSQRKGVLDDESYLQLSFQVVLNNAHRILNKRGIMTSYQVKNAEKLNSPIETEKTVKDSLGELDPFWKFK